MKFTATQGETMTIMEAIEQNIDAINCEDIEERIDAFEATIFTTDTELLALLPTSQLENRLRILRGYRAPLRYRVALLDVLAGR